ncbi:MAG: arginine--tRNA ligase, partial [Patescibacteria group bacterium]
MIRAETTTESTFSAISSAISDFFKKQGIAEPEISLDQPVFAVYGDVSSNACLRYAKELKKSPLDVANELAEYLRAQKKVAANVSEIRVVAPGYVNFFFTLDFFASVVEEIIGSKNFGANKNLTGQKWVVEHTSPNPNKAMHLGHLRNNLVGTSLVNLLEWNGAKVSTDAVMNDRGIAIAKMMYGFLVAMQKNAGGDVSVEIWIENPENWHTPESRGVLPDIFATECYLAGEKAFRESPDTEQKVRDLVVRWESHDKKVWQLWKHVLSFSYAGIERTLARLGGREFDKIWYESEHYEEGKKWVEKGIAAGIFKKLEDGAVVSDLSAYNLADTILLKKDGTSLYITQDLALTALKKKQYKADKLVWVVGPEQSLAFRQLFAICEQLGIGKREDFTHVPYGYVGLKDDDGNFKKMSSREGTVVLIDDVIDAAREKISAIAVGGAGDESVAAKNLPAETAEKLALAEVKFSILKSDRNQE